MIFWLNVTLNYIFLLMVVINQIYIINKFVNKVYYIISGFLIVKSLISAINQFQTLRYGKLHYFIYLNFVINRFV